MIKNNNDFSKVLVPLSHILSVLMLVWSSNGNLDFCRTNSYEEAKEKEKKKNVVVPAVASITSVVVPSGTLVDLENYEMRWQHSLLLFVLWGNFKRNLVIQKS